MSANTQARELLEMAAKAAGYNVKPHPNYKSCSDLAFTYQNKNWNPLTDDGEALRLAAKLGIHLQFAMDYAVAYAGSVHAKQFTERCGASLEGLTCRPL